MQPNSGWEEGRQKTADVALSTFEHTHTHKKNKYRQKQNKFSRGKRGTKRPSPVMPRFVSGALLPFSLNGLHFTLPCNLATAISASFQSGINHCGENVWEILYALWYTEYQNGSISFVCFLETFVC